MCQWIQTVSETPRYHSPDTEAGERNLSFGVNACVCFSNCDMYVLTTDWASWLSNPSWLFYILKPYIWLYITEGNTNTTKCIELELEQWIFFNVTCEQTHMFPVFISLAQISAQVRWVEFNLRSPEVTHTLTVIAGMSHFFKSGSECSEIIFADLQVLTLTMSHLDMPEYSFLSMSGLQLRLRR